MIQNKKPKEILDLEKLLGIELIKKKFADENEYTNMYLFDTDKNGNITYLDLNGLEWPNVKFIEKFRALKILGLDHCGLTNINELSLLTNLEILFLGGNNINTISSITKLINLRQLYLHHNNLTSIKGIDSLSNLIDLTLSRNKIDDFTPILKLQKIKRLCLDDSNLKDCSWLTKVESLEILQLDENKIEDISFIEKFNKYINIDLSDNLIRNIPENIYSKFDHWHDDSSFYNLPPNTKSNILIGNNPLHSPPLDVIREGKKAVSSYFENLRKAGNKTLDEARIILVGDGGAGKTSLTERILSNTFDPAQRQTNGVKINKWSINAENRNLQFNIWDFGGQEVQHAVHKFFLSESCLYILVLDNRKEEEPEYWLQHIESLGANSPVMVVFNKWDENPVDKIDRKFLKAKYPNIIGFYNVSCKRGLGISDFTTVLKEQAQDLKMVNEQFPANWFAIKQRIEKETTKKQHYLSFETYSEVCKANNLPDESQQKTLLKILNSIGNVTWFDDTYLQHYHILNPAWITQGVYKIVTGTKTKKLFGHIKLLDFAGLLQPVDNSDYTYDKRSHDYILALMNKFNLCYYNQYDKTLLIPSAFDNSPKTDYNSFTGEDTREYILQFKDYMPVAIIHQFIARNIEKANNKDYWYLGIVMQDSSDSQTLGMVQCDKDGRKIIVRVKGEQQLGLWEYIRREFATITSNYAHIEYEELLEVSPQTEIYVSYEDLLAHKQAGEREIFLSKLGRRCNVNQLLGWFEKETNEQRHSLKRKRAKSEPINVIIQNSIQTKQETNVKNEVNIDIAIELIQRPLTELQSNANYLLDELSECENEELKKALKDLLNVSEKIETSKTKKEVEKSGWLQKLGKIKEILHTNADFLDKIVKGKDASLIIGNAIAQVLSHFLISNPGNV